MGIVARFRKQRALAKGFGERVMAGIMTGSTIYAWPGGWSQDRLEQALHFKHWSYVFIRAIMQECSMHRMNLALVTPGDAEKPMEFHKSVIGHHRYLKTNHAIQVHETINYVGANHPAARLVSKPNDFDTWGDIIGEINLWLELTGNAYVWKPKNKLGLPMQVWVWPSHWVWPRTGHGRLIDYYEIRPWIGSSDIRIPPEEIVHLRFKNPLHKVDGYSPQTAGAEWIDCSESVDRSRFWQFKNGCFQTGAITLGEQYNDVSDKDLDRIYAKFFARNQGEDKVGRPIIMPPGATYTPLIINPKEMHYIESADQLRDYLSGIFQVPKEIVGIQPTGSELSWHAPLQCFSRFKINPRLRMIGESLTKHLWNEFDPNLRGWWDDTMPYIPEQLNNDIKTDADNLAITPNEIRALRGREPYKLGGDNPYGPVNNMELPLNQKVSDEMMDFQELMGGIGGPDGGGQSEATGGKTPHDRWGRFAEKPTSDDEKRFSFSTNGNGVHK